MGRGDNRRTKKHRQRKAQRKHKAGEIKKRNGGTTTAKAAPKAAPVKRQAAPKAPAAKKAAEANA